jgi:CRP-like cAMP-binding protein
MDASSLQRIDLFKALSKSELEQLAQWTDEIDVPAGKVLASEGAIAYEFFVIQHGTAAVEIDGRRVAVLGPGEWFGEIGLIAAERRTATVTATTPMRLVVIFGPNFRELARKLPSVAETIQAEIRERLART